MNGWLVLALCALCLLAGAALGYWTAAVDLRGADREYRDERTAGH